MYLMPYEDLVKRITEVSSLSKEEVTLKIEEKLKQLSGLISKEGAAHIIARELGIELVQKQEGSLKIKNIMQGMRDVEVAGRVAAAFPINEFTGKDGNKGKVGSLILADETGSIRVTFWHAMTEHLLKIKKNDTIKILSAYVRPNNGTIELQLNDKSKVEINPPGLKFEAPVQTNTRKQISQLTETDKNIELFGTIVRIFDLRFYEVCPECNRRIREKEDGFSCDDHGAVKPSYNSVVNLMLDDGTETIRCVFFTDQIAHLIGKTKDSLSVYKDNLAEFEKIKDELLGEQIIITGRTQKNTMYDRMEFVAMTVDPNPDIQKEIDRMKNVI